MKKPERFRIPFEMEEAVVVMETGFPPSILDQLPGDLVTKLMIYKNVRRVAEHGGSYDI